MIYTVAFREEGKVPRMTPRDFVQLSDRVVSLRGG